MQDKMKGMKETVTLIEKYMENSGMDVKAVTDARIEQHRKGDFTLRITRNGVPLTEGTVECVQLDHDFDFGCNLFMLNQYDDPAANELHLNQWKRLFNTAVVPFYWEGTEPEEGMLRYSAQVENNVYRRPPADMVVEYCRKNGIAMKGHPLFWHEFIPKWLPEDWNELVPLIEKRFREISERYGKTIPVFDCVNEPSRIWDICHERVGGQWKYLVPPPDYIEQVFSMAERYFPDSELILNETVGGAFTDYRGEYGGFMQLLDRLLKQGLRIDRIGLQCHTSDSPAYKNVFDPRRLMDVLDGYSRFGLPLVLSEISIPSTMGEELQAKAAEQLYRICFACPQMSGIFWWNLDDNGVLVAKARNMPEENLPGTGLVRNHRPKKAYYALEQLLHREWHTEHRQFMTKGNVKFRGFYGKYAVTITGAGFSETRTVCLNKSQVGTDLCIHL